MELSSLLSGSDNLFKYLFTLGALMIGFSIIYPYQKKYELKIEINTHNKEAELLDHEIKKLLKEANETKLKIRKILYKSDSLKKEKRMTKDSKKIFIIEESINALRLKANESFNQVKLEKEKIEVNMIIQKFSERRIMLLKEQCEGFSIHFFVLLILGVISLLIGIIFWAKSTKKTETLKNLEITHRRSTLLPNNLTKA